MSKIENDPMCKDEKESSNDKPYPEGDVLNEYFQMATKSSSVSEKRIHNAYLTLRGMLLEVVDENNLDDEHNVSKK